MKDREERGGRGGGRDRGDRGDRDDGGRGRDLIARLAHELPEEFDWRQESAATQEAYGASDVLGRRIST